jgi:hypothetical protein
MWRQYAAGGNRPTDLENIISGCLQYITIDTSRKINNDKIKGQK